MEKVAFVLAGGGPKGAYEAGVVDALIKHGIKPEVLAGVSIGAINALFLAMSLDTKRLLDLWSKVDGKTVFGRWTFGWLEGFFRGSLYTAKPLQKMIEAEIDPRLLRGSNRKLRVGAVSLTTGDYKLWTEQDKDINLGVAASYAAPLLLPYVKARAELWTDGGVRHVTPLRSAVIERATELFVVQPSPPRVGRLNKKSVNLWQRSRRELDIVLHETQMDDLQFKYWCQQELLSTCGEEAARNINLHIIKPSVSISQRFIDFTKADAAHAIKIGQKDGERIASKYYAQQRQRITR